MIIFTFIKFTVKYFGESTIDLKQVVFIAKMMIIIQFLLSITIAHFLSSANLKFTLGSNLFIMFMIMNFFGDVIITSNYQNFIVVIWLIINFESNF